MRIDTVKTKVYPFEELSDAGKEKAVELLWDLNAVGEWWESLYEDAEQIGLKITSFDIGRERYCEGDWTEDVEDVARLIIENHGKDCETYKTAWEFDTAIGVGGSVFEDSDDYDPEYEEYNESAEYNDLCSEFLRDICEDYRIMLQKEYEYLSSEEAIIETIKANEYEFTEDGKLY